MFDRILVANRGEIARRVIGTCHRLGIEAVAVYSEADANALHVREADEAVLLGPAPPVHSYLNAARVVEAAVSAGAQAVHPGYGFLSEDADFARAVAAASLVWVGPSPKALEAMGDKVSARNMMASAGVPVAAGTTEPLSDVEAAVAAASEVGYPLMVKAAAGGGGIGMGTATDEASLRAAFATAQARAERFFGSATILLERYLAGARHVEVQVLGLADGQVVALGERDCSVQRRHQKVAEECPSPAVGPELRARMLKAAVAAASAVDYRGAGTVEFLLDPVADKFVFLEMNTRLQVEHPVTEMVYGLDLVEAQLRIAAGQDLGFDPAQLMPAGHAIELRVYAEDPVRFLPGPGAITAWSQPTGDGVRVDAGYGDGDTVTPHYDPLLAKLCVWGSDRDQALARARTAVADFTIKGPKTNLAFFVELLDNPAYQSGDYDTSLIATMRSGKT